tara:strand:- start:469 stop:975 length:507 start_codon:yes stop_codon:yes gene_type:complete
MFVLLEGFFSTGAKMSRKRYVVDLTAEERAHLKNLIGKGKAAAPTLLKARILLKADAGPMGAGWADERIAEALETNVGMVYRMRRRLVEEGFEAALGRKRRETPPVKPVFDGEKQAKLTALACSKPPKGRCKWTLRLLAEKVVELEIVESVHFNTVGRALKKIRSSRI